MDTQTGNTNRHEAAFRHLRNRMKEVSAMITALTESADAAKMWRRIVRSSQVLLNVDGCSFYRVEGRELVAAVVLSRSLGLVVGAEEGAPFEYSPLRMTLSEVVTEGDPLAVRVAMTGRTINVPDVTHSKGYRVSRTKSFDEQMDYVTRSILTVPVRYRNGPVMGVLQFINIKNMDGDLVDFSAEQEDTAEMMAALLALSLSLP